MSKKVKVGRNDDCPCGENKKYKNCCEGKIDWEQVIKAEESDYINYLSPRGRNALFMMHVVDALQIDKPSQHKSLAEFKRAFTPSAVRKIYEAIIKCWPPTMDLNAILSRYSGDISGFFIGNYEPEYLLRAVNRHSVYSDRIILSDPLPYPGSMKDQFNPILHPEEFRSITLKFLHIWFSFLPWMEAGIVTFIRTPIDFDPELAQKTFKETKLKYDSNKDLADALERTIEEESERFFESDDAVRLMLLQAPDSYIRDMLQDMDPNMSAEQIESFIKYVHHQRETDPFYLPPLDDSEYTEYYLKSSGASYNEAKIVSSMSGSYLFTDLPSRWVEIELDRKDNKIGDDEWTPLSKAFQSVELKYLNNIDIAHALELRNRDRISSLRAFMKRIWNQARTGNPFNENNVKALADELDSQVKEAEAEWSKIDQDLIKWFGAESIGAIVASGTGNFHAAAVLAAAGAANITVSQLQRKNFPKKFPAAFFMNLQNE